MRYKDMLGLLVGLQGSWMARSGDFYGLLSLEVWYVVSDRLVILYFSFIAAPDGKNFHWLEFACLRLSNVDINPASMCHTAGYFLQVSLITKGENLLRF